MPTKTRSRTSPEPLAGGEELSLSIKTELEWAYQPPGFFEDRFVATLINGEFVADAGKAILSLTSPTNPVLSEHLQRVKNEVLGIHPTCR